MDGITNTRERIIEVAEQLLFLQGFSGTSLADIMSATQLTKGAFFHHFKNKHELAHTVLTRWADNDDALVQELVDRAAKLADDPLQEAVIFIKLFEDWLGKLEQPSNGCLFASFTYESEQFDPEMHQYVRKRLRIWMGLYQGIFERAAANESARADRVTGITLTEMLATIFEGGLLLGRALDDRHWLIRQLEQFRHYLQLVCKQ
ncbi:MAG: TetR family transcriptional regulator [Xanthomonadales bacterium]|nr:TetR family transcriptional regulator [Xanthomonadales bacterium]